MVTVWVAAEPGSVNAPRQSGDAILVDGSGAHTDAVDHGGDALHELDVFELYLLSSGADRAITRQSRGIGRVGGALQGRAENELVVAAALDGQGHWRVDRDRIVAEAGVDQHGADLSGRVLGHRAVERDSDATSAGRIDDDVVVPGLAQDRQGAVAHLQRLRDRAQVLDGESQTRPASEVILPLSRQATLDFQLLSDLADSSLDAVPTYHEDVPGIQIDVTSEHGFQFWILQVGNVRADVDPIVLAIGAGVEVPQLDLKGDARLQQAFRVPYGPAWIGDGFLLNVGVRRSRETGRRVADGQERVEVQCRLGSGGEALDDFIDGENEISLRGRRHMLRAWDIQLRRGEREVQLVQRNRLASCRYRGSDCEPGKLQWRLWIAIE